MVRKSVFWTLLDLVFLIAFNLIFFIDLIDAKPFISPHKCL